MCSIDMANIVLLLVIIMSMFSVIGITVFREVFPIEFGSMSSCIFFRFIKWIWTGNLNCCFFEVFLKNVEHVKIWLIMLCSYITPVRKCISLGMNQTLHRLVWCPPWWERFLWNLLANRLAPFEKKLRKWSVIDKQIDEQIDKLSSSNVI